MPIFNTKLSPISSWNETFECAFCNYGDENKYIKLDDLCQIKNLYTLKRRDIYKLRLLYYDDLFYIANKCYNFFQSNKTKFRLIEIRKTLTWLQYGGNCKHFGN